RVRVGNLQCRARITPGVERLQRLTTTTLEAALAIAQVRQEMFDCAQQKRPEAPPCGIGGSKAAALEHARKKFLREIARGLCVSRLGPNESKHRPIVRRAQIA